MPVGGRAPAPDPRSPIVALMDEPTVAVLGPGSTGTLDVDGSTLSLHAWRGSGPALLHVHHEDDEAWYVLEGVLQFRFADGRTVEAAAGTAVFVPAGVPHTYTAGPGARYLLCATPRIRALIAALQSAPAGEHPGIYRQHASELLE